MPRTRPHVFAQANRTLSKQPVRSMAREAGIGEAPVGYTLQGQTDNFEVYFQTALGIAGRDLAQGILGSCEMEYAELQQIFGISASDLPFRILIDDGAFGASHATCAATEIHCAAFDRNNVDLVRMVAVAEEVEVLEANLGNGWDCGATNGEALSRVLATELYPNELDGFATAASWLDSADRPDYVSTNLPDDTDPLSNGCGVLFLNYLHYQLHFSWADIVRSGGATLGETYQRLTGQADAFGPFSTLLAQHFPPGTPSGVVGDNVFPLASVNLHLRRQVAGLAPSPQGPKGRVLVRTA
jgi:hypothetical protein